MICKDLTHWYNAVLRRDDYCCQNCRNTLHLDAAHISRRSQRPDLRLNTDNGITLCRPCHTYFDERPAMFALFIRTKTFTPTHHERTEPLRL